MNIPSGISGFAQKVINYTKPRPTTGADTVVASPEHAAISGAFTGYIATSDPVGAIGSAAGGYVGIKVGQKTKSVAAAAAASVVTGAAASATLAAGVTLATAAASGVAATISPLGLGIFSAIGGLSGLSGMMQGSCMGNVKDSGTTGMMLGAAMAAAGGNPLLSVSGSLAGAVGGMFEDKALKYLAAAGTGAALGAASGAIFGPAGIAANAVMGAATGVVAVAAGPAIGQVQRNFTEDMQKGVFNKIKGLGKGLTKMQRAGIGAAGGALSTLPVALPLTAMCGPVIAAVPVVAMGALTGYKVYKAIEKAEKTAEFKEPINNFLSKDFTKEQIEQTPQPLMNGMTLFMAEKYKNDKNTFAAISQDQFRHDLKEFENIVFSKNPQTQEKQDKTK